MALINCPECGKEISNTAVSCPHCGYGINNNPVAVAHKKSIAIPIFLIICFIVGGLICIYQAYMMNKDIDYNAEMADLNYSLCNMTDPKYDMIIDTSKNEEYHDKFIEYSDECDRLTTMQNIWYAATGGCGVGICICIIIVISNIKSNKKLKQ